MAEKRVQVDLGGNWRLYANTLPANAEALGVVSVGVMRGALIRTSAGIYAQWNAGELRTLDQAAVRAALQEVQA